ncbi:MAG: hypothetical protein AB1778_09365, partial [Candidatus Bipolaricaulota bacterium]
FVPGAARRARARRRPPPPAGFREVSGVGEAKALQYAERFVAVLAETCRSRGLEMDIDPNVHAVPKPPGRGRKRRATVDLSRQLAYGRFDRGESLAAVADALHVPSDRALEFLLDYLRERRATTPEPWVDGERFARVVASAREVGAARPISILRDLDGGATYEDVLLSLACLENEA